MTAATVTKHAAARPFHRGGGVTAVAYSREELRAEVDRRRRQLLGLTTPLKAPQLAPADIIAVAAGTDLAAFARLRLACCEFSPIDPDLHAAQVLLDLQRIHVRAHQEPTANLREEERGRLPMKGA